MSYTIGIDVGGTFTDSSSHVGRRDHHRQGRDDAGRSVRWRAGRHRPLAEPLGLALPRCSAATSRIVHGTTVATNALLEGKAARVGMLTTEGHRDIIEMREGLKPERYNLRLPPPRAAGAARLRLAVRERLRADGAWTCRWTPRRWTRRWIGWRREGVDAVAICFLHAWHNPAHEQRGRGRRARAAAARLHHHLGRRAAADQGVRALLHHRRQRRGRAGDRRLSAPAGRAPGASGLRAARCSSCSRMAASRRWRRRCGSPPAPRCPAPPAASRRRSRWRGKGCRSDLITFDMGGTSTDIALVQDGQPALTGRRGGRRRAHRAAEP